MIRSMLKQLQLGETDQSLLSFIDKAMRVEERKKLLESHYSQELSLLYVLQEDYDRAKYYTNCAIELFMEVCCCTAFLLLPLLFQSRGKIVDSLCDQWLCSISLTPTELLQCGYAVDSKSIDHAAVSAGFD